MATNALTRPLDRSYLLRALRAFYRRRLTARGRFVLWATLALAFVGIDTRRSLVFVLFSLAAPPLLVALGRLFAGRRTTCALDGRLPARLTAGRAGLAVARRRRDATAAPPARSRSSGPGRCPTPALLRVTPDERTVEAEARRPARVTDRSPPATARPLRPARPSASRDTDLFGLVRTKAVWLPEQVVLAYPRYYTLDELPLPMGRRYQPGGIPLASEVGDSLEFVGTREYREGDPLRKIHWRSWARLGKPVVKEYQEEYFSRIALVLDTFLPKRPRPRERARFEAAISMLASVAEHFSRSEEVVDILAAGPDLYEVSTGRSLGHSRQRPRRPRLPRALARAALRVDRARRSSSGSSASRRVVAVMLEWDEAREAFLRRVRAMGVAVRVLLVHEGETRKPWAAVSADLGEIERSHARPGRGALARRGGAVRRVRPTRVRVSPTPWPWPPRSPPSRWRSARAPPFFLALAAPRRWRRSALPFVEWTSPPAPRARPAARARPRCCSWSRSSAWLSRSLGVLVPVPTALPPRGLAPLLVPMRGRLRPRAPRRSRPGGRSCPRSSPCSPSPDSTRRRPATAARPCPS